MAACSSPAERRERSLAAGRKFLETKDYRRAVLEFRSAIQAAPKEAEPVYQLALAQLASGDVLGAVNSLRSALALDARHQGAQLKLAELMVSTSNREVVSEGEKRAADILESFPDSIEALLVAGLAEAKLGRPEEAMQRFEQILAKSPTHLKAAASTAVLKLRSKDYLGAEETLKKIAPTSAEGAVLLGELYALTNRREAAEREFLRALKIDPTNTFALRHMIAIYTERGQLLKADEAVKSLAASSKPYRMAYAATLVERGQLDAAATEFQRLIDADPKDRHARGGLVTIYASVNRHGDAMRLLDDSLSQNLATSKPFCNVLIYFCESRSSMKRNAT